MEAEGGGPEPGGLRVEGTRGIWDPGRWGSEPACQLPLRSWGCPGGVSPPAARRPPLKWPPKYEADHPTPENPPC